MSGLGFIIQGADFSNSPLGSVILKKTPTEVVDSYLSSVGADSTMRTKLITLYRELSRLGVIENIDVFPMLGSSLANKLVGLKPSGEEFFFHSLQAGDNASSISEGIAFADTDPNVNSLTPVVKSLDDYHGLYVFGMVAPRRAGTGRGNSILLSNNTFCYISTGAMSGKAVFGLTRELGYTAVTTETLLNTFGSVSSYIESDKISTYLNGHLWFTESINQTVLGASVNNILAKQNDTAPHFFNADVKMLALGQIDAAKVSDVDAAFRAYWE